MVTERVTSSRQMTTALVAIAAGAVVSLALGLYGSQHTPTGDVISTFGFGSMIAMKVWLGVATGGLAVVQLTTALWMYGRFGAPAPPAVSVLHRVSGLAAIVVSLPVAYHCLWSLGFQTYDTRVVFHSVVGCVLYGVFVVKVFAVHSRSGPGWLLPSAGSALLVSVVVVVVTSSLWYLTEFGVPPTGGGY